MAKFKELNQFEIEGLESLLEEIFPFLKEKTVGTCKEGLKNIQNTFTEHSPNDKYCMLSAFGLSKFNEIILEYYDAEEMNCKQYYLSFREAQTFVPSDLSQFNFLLKKYIDD